MRKAIFFALFLFCFDFLAHSQTSKGSFMIGASNLLELRNVVAKQKSDNGSNFEAKTTKFSIEPLAGYFIIDRLAVGVIPGFHYLNEDMNQSKLRTTEFSLIPYGRYYLGKNRFKAFAHAGIGYLHRSLRNEFDFVDSQDAFKWGGSALVYEGGIGGAYFLNDFVSLDLFLRYRRYNASMNYKTDPELNESLKFDHVSSDFQLNLSLLFYFRSDSAAN